MVLVKFSVPFIVLRIILAFILYIVQYYRCFAFKLSGLSSNHLKRTTFRTYALNEIARKSGSVWLKGEFLICSTRYPNV